MASSTEQEKSLPKVDDVTFDVLRAYSCVFAPSRARSLWYVVIPERSVTPTEAEAVIELFVALLAVIV